MMSVNYTLLYTDNGDIMSKRLTTNEFIQRANVKHNNKFDYSKVEYVNNNTMVCIICPIHGEFWQKPINHFNGGCLLCANINRSNNQRLTTNEFIHKAGITHNNKYDYSKVEYINAITKVCIICPNHGEFWQTPNDHNNNKHGCMECGRIKSASSNTLTTDEFIQRSNVKHNNKFDYSKVGYVNTRVSVCIICPIHGEFWQTPNNHLSGCGCPMCINLISDLENNINIFITSFGIETIQSSRFIIKPFELDIVIPSKNIAIEFNGNYWHSELNGKLTNYHLNKTKLCEDINIQLIHIFEDEWINKQQIVKNRIQHILGKTPQKIQARKCEIHEITSTKSSQFLNKYHIQGQDKSSIRLGLFYRNRMVALMTFSKRRFDKKDGYELVRYCTVGHFTVIGGAGKLLKHFERIYDPVSIISYADKRWSTGGLYKTLGFKHIHDSTPNYFYMITPMIRESRHKYQKHKLHKILDNFDPKLSEWENMKNNGYDRIWDCGNMVFEKTYH